MIIARISGGLGNQMFQYAFARAFTHATGMRAVIDTSQVNSTSTASAHREVEINNFTVSIPLRHMSWFRIFSKLSRRDVIEPSFTYNPHIVTAIKDWSYVSGIWQSEKYFKDIRDILLTEFSLKNPLSPTAQPLWAEITKRTAVSIHIRRGDYVVDTKTNSKHGVCPPEYYKKAVDYISSHVQHPQFYIFSDDIAWVKEHMSLPESSIFVSQQGIASYEELMLMKECKHNIVANSSFSWWGAWLNKNPQKIVIAPQKWFNAPIPTTDLLPVSWIQL
jgi:hypothetical protein